MLSPTPSPDSSPSWLRLNPRSDRCYRHLSHFPTPHTSTASAPSLLSLFRLFLIDKTTIRHKLLENHFRKYGDCPSVQLLLAQGARFEDVPGGLLEDTFRKYGDGLDVQFLLAQGARFGDVPCGLPKLLEDTFRKYGDGLNVQFLLAQGARFEDVPCGLPKLLEDTFHEHGDGLNVQLLLAQGARFKDVWSAQIARGHLPQVWGRLKRATLARARRPLRRCTRWSAQIARGRFPQIWGRLKRRKSVQYAWIMLREEKPQYYLAFTALRPVGSLCSRSHTTYCV
jgi:hypothetical protein